MSAILDARIVRAHARRPRVARRIARLRRGAVKQRQREPDFTVQSIADLTPGASTVIRQQETQRQLIEALQRLPVEIQITLELHYWEDMGVTEIARVTGVPSGTVKSRLYRGRQLTKHVLEKHSS